MHSENYHFPEEYYSNIVPKHFKAIARVYALNAKRILPLVSDSEVVVRHGLQGTVLSNEPNWQDNMSGYIDGY